MARIDERGAGGYAVAPPSVHISGDSYRWDDPSVPVTDAPTWLVGLLVEPKRKTLAMPARVYDGTADGTDYGLAALNYELERVRSAQKGGRNHALNAAAFSLGQLEEGGELAAGVVEEALLHAALACGLGQVESVKTIGSGLAKGRENPRSAPERDRPPVVRRRRLRTEPSRPTASAQDSAMGSVLELI